MPTLINFERYLQEERIIFTACLLLFLLQQSCEDRWLQENSHSSSQDRNKDKLDRWTKTKSKHEEPQEKCSILLLMLLRAREERRSTYPLIKLSFDEAGHDAADAVTVAADLRLIYGQPGCFSRQSSLQVEVDGPLEVPLVLLHRTGLVVLTRLDQPLKIVLAEVIQFWVPLGSLTQDV